MKLVIGVATYNEALNIESLVSEIHRYLPEQRVLIIDDNSPDGTRDVVEKMMVNDPYLRIIHRPGKMGLGTAHIVMMRYVVENNFDGLITMDADFSHQPKYLPQIAGYLWARDAYDFVIGSRYVDGGRSCYGFSRNLISKIANWGANKLAGIPLKECTTAYRGYRSELLRKLPLGEIKSNGYSFMVESLYHVIRCTDKIIELPIEFIDRKRGSSKINRKEMLESACNLLRLFYRRKFGKIGKKSGCVDDGRRTRG
ncbi:MAG: polyprenol monophosphomannose synthase [Oligoflexia bacterium]|nr:polyprenol monophosphomannose synthase [Oligoflexia bacterium]